MTCPWRAGSLSKSEALSAFGSSTTIALISMRISPRYVRLSPLRLCPELSTPYHCPYACRAFQVRLMQTIVSGQQSLVVNTLNRVLESDIDMLDRCVRLFVAHDCAVFASLPWRCAPVPPACPVCSS